MEGWANEAWDFSALWKAQIIVKQKHGQPTANLAFIFLICAPMAWGARLRDWRCAEKKTSGLRPAQSCVEGKLLRHPNIQGLEQDFKNDKLRKI